MLRTDLAEFKQAFVQRDPQKPPRGFRFRSSAQQSYVIVVLRQCSPPLTRAWPLLEMFIALRAWSA